MSEKLTAIVEHMHEINPKGYEDEQHFHNIMWYAYGFHLALTNEELVTLTWYAQPDGYWSPELSKAYLEFKKRKTIKDSK